MMDTLLSQQLKKNVLAWELPMYYSGHFVALPGEKFVASLQVGKLEKWTNKSETLNWITKFQAGAR